MLTLNHESQLENVWNQVLSLIGNFDLDPDRVLDLVIEAFTRNTDLEIYISMIKKFKRESVSPIIGNKLLKATPEDMSEKIIFCGSI